MPDVNIKDIKNFFGYESLAAFSVDWKQLTDADKEHIKSGLRDGTHDYAV